MKYTKIIFSLLFLLIYASCSTAEDVHQSTVSEADAMSALNLLYCDSLDLSSSTFSLNSDDVRLLFPLSIDDYRRDLLRYDELFSDASKKLATLLENAALSALSSLKEFDFKVEDPVESLVENNLFSSNRSAIINHVRPVISEYIENEKEEFDNSYSLLSFECLVLKANYENLESVGFTSTLEPVGAFSYENAALFAATKLYESLVESEARLRNTPLSQQENPLYRLFWEVI